MQDKTTHFPHPAQDLIAGLIPSDSGIEFFGIRETKEVKYLQNGHVKDFNQLPVQIYRLLSNAYHSSASAREVISEEAEKTSRQVELYTYYTYGTLDNTPDFVNGQLQDPENFRHSRNCRSLSFKKLTINGHPLKEREIIMIDLFADEDAKDEAVAIELGITRSTLNQHKQELFEKSGVQTKTGLLMKAFQNHLPFFKRQFSNLQNQIL